MHLFQSDSLSLSVSFSLCLFASFNTGVVTMICSSGVSVRDHMCIGGLLVQCSVMLLDKKSFLYLSVSLSPSIPSFSLSKKIIYVQCKVDVYTHFEKTFCLSGHMFQLMFHQQHKRKLADFYIRFLADFSCLENSLNY